MSIKKDTFAPLAKGLGATRRAAMLLLVMMLTTMTAWAQTPSGNWNDWVSENNIDWSSADAKAAAIPQSDDGSTVYISTAEQLAYYAYAVNNDKQTSGSASGYYCGRTVELMADIDLSAHYWKPIGWSKYYYFNGYFHGNGHVITGMHVNGDPQSDNAGYNNPGYGLFGYLHTRNGGTSTITDLVLKDFSINASYSGNNSDEFYLGGLVGRCDDNTAITNCLLVNGSVSKDVNNNWAHIGKVAGGGSPSIASVNYYHNVSVSGWRGVFEHYAQQTIGGETEARAVALTISGTHGSVALGGTMGRISGGIIYAPANETVTLNTTTDAGYIASLATTGLTLTSGQFTMPDNDDGAITATVSIDPAHFSVNDAGTEYTIKTAAGWNVFCDALQDNDTYNRFSGKTVRLGADIAVSRMAGSSKHDFCGTFDGGSNTLTVNISSDDITDGSTQYVAPFRYVSNTKADPSDEANSPAAFRNLHVTGTITTAMQFTGGLIGGCWGTVSIDNCAVSTAITSTISGDGTHGGIVGIQQDGTLYIRGTVFDGSLLGATTYAVGGFLGYRRSAAEIRNSLFAPAEVTVMNTSGATFARNKVDTYNSYYTYYLCDGTNYAPYDPADADHPDKYNNGHATRTVTAATDVTIGAVALTGTATPYTVSGITAYSGGGLQRGETLYYGSGDQLSLTLSNSATGAPQGYQYGYTASAGTLDGTALTMPDADVTISVNTAALRSTGQPVTVAYINADGTAGEASAIALDGHETSLAAGTYFAGLENVNFDHTVNLTGNVTLILCDGCTMNVGTSGSRIDGKGFGNTNYNIDIYAQSLGTGALTIYNSSTYSGRAPIAASALTINGGIITADASGTNAIYAIKDVTINRGTVTANGSDSGIFSNSGDIIISGGTVNATAGTSNSGINARAGNVAINGGNVTATGGTYGIRAGDNITLGWTRPADRITASSYSGTVQVADGQTLTDGTEASNGMNGYSGTLTNEQITAIGGKTLHRAVTTSYVDASGTLHENVIAIPLINTMTTLAAGWYVVNENVDYTGQITLSGNVKLILGDDCTMSFGKEGAYLNATIIECNNHNLTIYGQSGGTGWLKAYSATSSSINHVNNYTQYSGNVLIRHLNAYCIDANNSVTLLGGTLDVESGGILQGGDISGGYISILGGKLWAWHNGLWGPQGITLGYTNATDQIYVNIYHAGGMGLQIADGKTLVDDYGVIWSGALDYNQIEHGINGITLKPLIYTGVTLTGNGYDVSATFSGSSETTVSIPVDVNVTRVTYERTFTEGKPSTVMLPFSLGEGQTLTGGTLYKFTGVTKNETTGMWEATMTETATLQANTPYLLMPDNELVDGKVTFNLNWGTVTLNTTGGGNCVTADPGSHWTFKGTYAYREWIADGTNSEEIGKAYGFAGVQKTGIEIGDFVRVASGAKIRPMGCYLLWSDTPNAAPARRMTRGASVDELPSRITVRLVSSNGETTGIGEIDTKTGEMTFDSEAWYTLDGVRLNGKPTKKGLYINNGKKIVIK